MEFMQMSPQEILDLANPTREYAEILKSWPKPTVDWNNRPKALARARTLTDMAKECDEPDPMVAEEHLKIPARNGRRLDLWVLRPIGATANGVSPLVVLYHGGGFVMGGPVDVVDTGRAIVKRFGAVVVLPSYRLAPEEKFPAMLDDGWDSLTWIARNAQIKLRADPSEGFVVAGESAGGSLAVVLAHLARDRGLLPRITGLWLSAVTVRMPNHGADLEEEYKGRYLSRSQPECLNNPIYSSELDELISACIDADHSSHLFCPGVWPGDQGHKNLPPMYIQLCGRDLNRDEGLIFKDMVEKSGGKTKLTLYKGLPHCFWISLKSIPEFTQWQKDSMDGFRWLLDA